MGRGRGARHVLSRKFFKLKGLPGNRRTEAVSFVQCPQFDVEPEPSISGVVTVSPASAAAATGRHTSYRDWSADRCDGFAFGNGKPGSTETAWGMLADAWTAEVRIVCGQAVRLQLGDGGFRVLKRKQPQAASSRG